MRFANLPEWLAWQETLHFKEVDPGLPRIRAVWEKMAINVELPYKLVTVAGTNGKGSSVAILSSILQAAGYKTATYTSPHILRYNERICIDGEPCSDALICEVFELIDQVRGDTSLTYFEFSTLAAVTLFSQQKVDIAILEVGMGGRLDATNLFDADIALITPIDLDHTQWLGDTREKIGYEKAGIIRESHPVVCAEAGPPNSLLEYANKNNAPVFMEEQDYHYDSQGDTWHWQSRERLFKDLPKPNLEGLYQLQNSAAVLQVCELLNQQDLPISEQAIRQGLSQVKLAGRFQVIPGDITRILDVTHNQQGANNLREILLSQPLSGKTYAVLAMLKDKDANRVAQLLNDCIDGWFLAGLDGDRGMTSAQLKTKISGVIDTETYCYQRVKQAYDNAMKTATSGDRVLIFGSFHTVEEAIKAIEA